MKTPRFQPGDVACFCRKFATYSWTLCTWLSDFETVTVQRNFKNGDAAVALHDVYADGKDGRRTIHVPQKALFSSKEVAERALTA